MNSTRDEFDPYRKWLGIPPESRPPNNYQLLGIPPFEEDPDVIENATDRQMAHVRTFQAGKYSALSQQVLNELARARICLLDEKKKQEYDSQLRELEQPHNSDESLEEFKLSNHPIVPPNLEGISDSNEFDWRSAVSDRGRDVTSRSRSAKKTQIQFVALGLGLLALLAVFAGLVMNVGNPLANDSSSSENNLPNNQRKASPTNRPFDNSARGLPLPGEQNSVETETPNKEKPAPPPETGNLPQPTEEKPEPPTKTPVDTPPKIIPAEPTDSNSPAIPEGESKRLARNQFNKKYKDRISQAKTIAKTKELVKQLLDEAAEQDLEPAYRFILLNQARELELKMSRVDEVFKIIHEMARHFELDPLQEKMNSLNKLVSNVKTNSDALEIYKRCEQLSQEALLLQRYDDAVEIARLAQTAAKRANHLVAMNRARAAPKQIRLYESALKKAEQAKESLANDPQNPRANSVLGSFQCFFLGQWKQGLPKLARSSDRGLRTLADRDLQNPSDARAQWALGEAWLLLAHKKRGIIARNMTLRGKFWLIKAVPALPKEAKKLANQRLKEINLWLELN